MKLNFVLNSLNPRTMGPIKQQLNVADQVIDKFPNEKHWMCGGYRSAAVAARMLLDQNIIAVPTDTIYGLAGLAQSTNAISKLYDIKKRNLAKPLSICLGDVNDINKWAEVADLPSGLIESLLPGPTTVVLKRKEVLNPLLNNGISNIGIRIPKMNFILCVMKMVNQPIALTSANMSQEISTLHPTEFEHLWPSLSGIFYETQNPKKTKSINRSGSTVVDLSVKGEYRILRKGKGSSNTERILKNFNLQKRKEEEPVKDVKNCTN